jgi:hypothetical protein
MARLPLYERIESVLTGEYRRRQLATPRPNCRREDGLVERPKRGVATDIHQHSVADRPTAGIAGLGMNSLPLSTARDAEERVCLGAREAARYSIPAPSTARFDRLCQYSAR